MSCKSKRDIAYILYFHMFSKIATLDIYKQYYLSYTDVLLYIFTWKYFAEHINAHIFQQLYEYMMQLAVELYGNISTISLLIL